MNNLLYPHLKHTKARLILGVLAACFTLGLIVQNLNAQNSPEAVQTQTELEDAKEAAIQLRSQLDQAERKLADLQSKLEQANARLADLQSTKSQPEGVTARPVEPQARIVNEDRGTTAIQPVAPKERGLPIFTTFQKTPIWGYDYSFAGSFMLHIKSVSSETLILNITFTRKGQTIKQSGTIASGEEVTLYGLAKQDTATIESQGYDPVNVTVP